MPEKTVVPLAQPFVSWSGLSDVGRYRKNNEDAFLALALDGEGVYRLGKFGQSPLSGSDYIFAVSDGMGGANAGDFASRVAVEKITQLLPKAFREAESGLPVDYEAILSELFNQIHQQLVFLGICYKELSGMGATLSLCWLHGDHVFFAHVGDSRIYHLSKSNGFIQMSEDHTHVGWQFRNGQLNERESRSHPGRNSLQQVLGGKNQHLSPQFGTFSVTSEESVILCSDGLIEGLWNRGIERIVKKETAPGMETLAERLVRESVQADGTDNTTAVVFQIKGEA